MHLYHLLLCGSPPSLMITSFFISVFYKVATEGPTNQRSTVSRSRTVNLGTGPRGLPANARTSSSVNQDDNSGITRHRGNGDGTGVKMLLTTMLLPPSIRHLLLLPAWQPPPVPPAQWSRDEARMLPPILIFLGMMNCMKKILSMLKRPSND
jgi:hypothetical protein